MDEQGVLDILKLVIYEKYSIVPERVLAEAANQVTALIASYSREARIKELELHKSKKCICEESGIIACDSLWHHSNNIDERIAELKALGGENE